MQRIQMGTRRRFAAQEWFVGVGLALVLGSAAIWDAHTHPDPLPVFETVPLRHDGTAVCPSGLEHIAAIDDATVTCSSVEVR
jgi:hypothetical protein